MLSSSVCAFSCPLPHTFACSASLLSHLRESRRLDLCLGLMVCAWCCDPAHLSVWHIQVPDPWVLNEWFLEPERISDVMLREFGLMSVVPLIPWLEACSCVRTWVAVWPVGGKRQCACVPVPCGHGRVCSYPFLLHVETRDRVPLFDSTPLVVFPGSPTLPALLSRGPLMICPLLCPPVWLALLHTPACLPWAVGMSTRPPSSPSCVESPR